MAKLIGFAGNGLGNDGDTKTAAMPNVGYMALFAGLLLIGAYFVTKKG